MTALQGWIVIGLLVLIMLGIVAMSTLLATDGRRLRTTGRAEWQRGGEGLFIGWPPLSPA
jgi:hypothetical protein